MSYTLGTMTLPNPKSVSRDKIRQQILNTTIKGVSKRKVLYEKEQFVLKYAYISMDTLNAIIDMFQNNEVQNFTVDETNLVIASTPVLMDMSTINFSSAGRTFYTDFDLVLMEVI